MTTVSEVFIPALNPQDDETIRSELAMLNLRLSNLEEFVRLQAMFMEGTKECQKSELACPAPTEK